MAPRELVVNITKARMDKLGQYGEHIPIRIKGAGKSGEYHAVMGNPLHGGMLSAAGQQGGMLSAVGAEQVGGKLNLLNLSKKIAGVASPLSMLAGPEAAPIAAALGAYAGSGKRQKKAKAVKKNVDLAAQIAAIVAQSQGYEKEAGALRDVGRVVKGSGKKSKKVKNTASDIANIASILGAASGYMTPQQAMAAQAVGSLIQGSGPQDLTGDIYFPPENVLSPRTRGAPKVAVVGGAHGASKKKPRFAVAR